ncbi:hypothetical protein PRK78_007442 [Emydomyces testavorans]|uniref:Uncharacterized protein n=1 Tax=Emydomyces testavorans TaxID=2070801 RepID=A0AAF0DQA3_9EURO|nr:hypothetical protein PRK78_007442 [Emydomyces testavorans]
MLWCKTLAIATAALLATVSAAPVAEPAEANADTAKMCQTMCYISKPNCPGGWIPHLTQRYVVEHFRPVAGLAVISEAQTDLEILDVEPGVVWCVESGDVVWSEMLNSEDS